MMNLNTVSEFVTLSYRIEIIANVVPLIQTTPVSLHTREAMLHQNIAYINKKKMVTFTKANNMDIIFNYKYYQK